MMYWDGNMGGWGYVLMVISFVLFWGAVIAAVVLLARALGPGNRSHNLSSGHGYAENLLAERFAAEKSTRTNTPPGSTCSDAAPADDA